MRNEVLISPFLASALGQHISGADGKPGSMPESATATTAGGDASRTFCVDSEEASGRRPLTPLGVNAGSGCIAYSGSSSQRDFADVVNSGTWLV